MAFYRPATSTWDAVVYGTPHVNTLQYLQAGVQQLHANLTPIGEQFMEKARSLYESFNGSEAMRKARAALGKVQTLFQVNTILPFEDLAQFQNAGPVMQRWIMASPMVGRWQDEQRLDGYASTWVEPQPGVTGEENYNYRRVMNHVMQDTPDGNWSATSYHEDLYEGDRELLHHEQIDILHSWEWIEAHLRRHLDDPTSQDGGAL